MHAEFVHHFLGNMQKPYVTFGKKTHISNICFKDYKLSHSVKTKVTLSVQHHEESLHKTENRPASLRTDHEQVIHKPLRNKYLEISRSEATLSLQFCRYDFNL